MTSASTAIPKQVYRAATTLAFAFVGANFIPLSQSTAPSAPSLLEKPRVTTASTALELPAFQATKASTAETQLSEWPEDQFQAILASAEGLEIISTTRNELQTEEALDTFERRLSEFIDRHGAAAIHVIDAELIRPTKGTLQPLTFRALRALGAHRTPIVDSVAEALLMSQLSGASAGRRSATASALGAFPSPAVLTALEERLAVETNRFVIPTLKAQIRFFKAHGIGISSTKAV
jgi:hypothetical protein